MIDIKNVVHFTIAVSDTRRSEAFYRDVLGLKTVHRAPKRDMVFMTAGTDYVILTGTDLLLDQNPGNEIRIHHAFGVDVDRYQDSLDYIRSKGVEVYFEEDRREGVFVGHQAYVHDPDRNVIEVIGLEQHGGDFGLNPADDPPPYQGED